jgi:four helix bundle protein
MATFKRFEDIEAWKQSRNLVDKIYVVTKVQTFKSDVVLSSQIKKSAISIISNIAEGFDRESRKEFIYFLSISKGSCGELKTQLYLALDQKYISSITFDEIYNLTDHTSKLIHNLIVYLGDSNINGLRYKH